MNKNFANHLVAQTQGAKGAYRGKFRNLIMWVYVHTYFLKENHSDERTCQQFNMKNTKFGGIKIET